MVTILDKGPEKQTAGDLTGQQLYQKRSPSFFQFFTDLSILKKSGLLAKKFIFWLQKISAIGDL